eukprot:428502-Prorocentrum_minimum.AAC.1
MTISTRANPQPATSMAATDPQLEQPERIVMDIVGHQKSYDRMIDAPTAVKDSDLATAAAINSINVSNICTSWIKLYGQFNGLLSRTPPSTAMRSSRSTRPPQQQRLLTRLPIS